MNVDEAISTRKTIRRFTPDPVPATDIRQILALAARAPSVGNRQMWRFIVVAEERLRSLLGRQVERRIDALAGWQELSGQAARIAAWKQQALHFVEAPAVIVVIGQSYNPALNKLLVDRGMKPWEVDSLFARPDIQSIGAMVGYLLLAAYDRGYGACWLTSPLIAKRELQATFELKANEEIVCMVSLGKPADAPLQKPRKAIDRLIEWR